MSRGITKWYKGSTRFRRNCRTFHQWRESTKENRPSETALRVATRRAAHQVLDDPKVFDDPLALRILGVENASALPSDHGWLEETPLSRTLRASLAARSRYAEDELHFAVERGIRRYVVLGAGLDTFACRSPYPGEILRVFEVDHPDTQAWKRSLLEKASIPIPRTLTFSPVDFETETLEKGLLRAGFDTGRRAFFSWLGVTPYLTGPAITSTLRFVASMPAGSGIVFDYMISPSSLGPTARRAYDSLAHRVASAGEPFKTFFDPSSLPTLMRDLGFGRIEDIDPEELNARYFRGRIDKLRVGSLAHLMNAQV
ncbi:MAG: SAM-dependent methyltransferase [Deltaproteobacteria bacterium]|nr:MAG: SAM-dependent methyltransferase [Deltaproteobacteria bacterium]